MVYAIIYYGIYHNSSFCSFRYTILNGGIRGGVTVDCGFSLWVCCVLIKLLVCYWAAAGRSVSELLRLISPGLLSSDWSKPSDIQSQEEHDQLAAASPDRAHVW